MTPTVLCSIIYAVEKLRLVLYSSYAEHCRGNTCWRSGRLHSNWDSFHANSSSPFYVLTAVVGRDLNCSMYEAVVSSREGYQVRLACKPWLQEHRQDGQESRRTNCRPSVEKRGKWLDAFLGERKRKRTSNGAESRYRHHRMSPTLI